MKNKQINIQDIKNSPYFVATLLFLVIALVVAGIAYFIIGIGETKQQIVDTRAAYEENVKALAYLEEIRAQNEKIEEQIEMYEGILPDDLGDVYVLQENVIKTCKNFSLDVTGVEVVQVPAQTQETTFTLTVEGSFKNIYEYMNYISNLEQIHRFDSVSLKRSSENSALYSVTLTLAVLSRDGADGVVSAVVDNVEAAVTEKAES